MSEQPKKAIWIIMHLGLQGWMASMDHYPVYRTRVAARRRLALLGEKGKMYKIFKFTPEPPKEQR